MNTKSIILIIITVLLYSSCNRDREDQLCGTTDCKQYYSVWKNLFMKRNGISETWFRKHVRPFESEISGWSQGESFRVGYSVDIEWMNCIQYDQFIIRTDETTYPQLNINRGPYLTEEEIDRAVSGFAFSSHIAVINPVEKLAFSSKRDALKSLHRQTGTSGMSAGGFKYPAAKPIFTPSGNPIMDASGDLNREENICQFGEIDLVNKEAEAWENACWYE
jgi:hypothetical protein